MKKRLLLGMLLFAGLTASAQDGGLPNGTTAPDFTATDIKGQTHHLSEYLEQGKTVVLYISATWCNPCWAFHNTHYLSDLYYAYGQGAGENSNVVVLYIEGDSVTTLDDLYGVASQPGITLGDWVTGTPYPIIDNAALAEANYFDIDFFPTIYKICPTTGKTTQIPRGTPAELLASIEDGCNEVNGLENYVKIDGTDKIRICENGESVSLQASMRNFGTNEVTNAEVVLKENGTVIATQNYTGNLAQYADAANLTFNDVEFSSEATYTLEAVNVNSVAAAGIQKVKQFDVVLSSQSNNNFEVRVYTDNYPSEASWKIKDSDGNVVASGGPYQPGTADQYGGGGPDANTTKTHYITLTEGNMDCYSVEVSDAFNDGWSLGSTPHGIEIFSAGESVFKELVGDFGSTKNFGSAFKTNGILNTKAVERTSSFTVFPNPTTGVLNFATQESVDVTIMDITGKTVLIKTGVNNGESVNIGNLQKGMYIAKIKGTTAEKTEKIILN